MILQISYFIEYPPLIGIILVSVGVLLFFIGGFLSEESNVSGVLGGVGGLGFAIGTTIGTIQLYQSETFLLAILTSIPGQFISGLSAVRLYQKLSYAAQNKTLSLPGVGFLARIKLKLGILFAILFIFTIGSSLIIAGVIEIPLANFAVSIYAIITILYTFLGLGVKLYGINDKLRTSFSAGLILIVAGSQVVNLSTIPLDIFLTLVGGVAYSLGFWIAALRFINEDPILKQVR